MGFNEHKGEVCQSHVCKFLCVIVPLLPQSPHGKVCQGHVCKFLCVIVPLLPQSPHGKVGQGHVCKFLCVIVPLDPLMVRLAKVMFVNSYV